MGKKKNIYFTSPSIKDVVENNQEKIKVYQFMKLLILNIIFFISNHLLLILCVNNL